MGEKSGFVFIGLGFELLVLVLGGLYIGEKVDQIYDLGGYGVLIVLAACLISWTVHFVFLIKKFMADAEEFEKNNFNDEE
ncbi:MAG: hypothetical protein HOO06_00755 [Bdellovibrionaceae bacterium]|jgi:hypothetical protein|nr:hypothetical protein [Pseudobdellovibrionaceae bacterium]